MKTLHLIRHAKSSWKNLGQEDINRPLNDRGEMNSLFMRSPLLEANCQLSTIYTSPAERARQTVVNLIKGAANEQVCVKADEALYTFDMFELLQWCRNCDDTESEITLVAHNPAITDLVNYLTNSNIENVPTCGYVQIEIHVDFWRQLNQGIGELAKFIYPKMF